MRPPIDSDAWLARLFLLSIAAAGAYSVLSGAPPEAIGVVPCPVHAVTGVPCPGCGMTHALIALARGDVSAAVGYHPCSVFLVALAAGFACCPDRMRLCWRTLPARTRTSIVVCFCVAVFGLWACRLAG